MADGSHSLSLAMAFYLVNITMYIILLC